jgi:glutaredoxin
VSGSPAAVVELYGRDGCCLCDDARTVLERLRDELGFELLEVDIATDEALHRAYFERIPVVRCNGDELFDFHVDEAVLRAALAAAEDDLESRR